MKTYNLINPFDSVTFRSPSFEAALCATILAGNGRYGAYEIDETGQRVEGAEPVPVFIMGIGFAAYLEALGVEFLDLLDVQLPAVIKTLRSFCTGPVTVRPRFDSAIEKFTDPGEETRYRKWWDEQNRASPVAISRNAWHIARSLEVDGVQRPARAPSSPPAEEEAPKPKTAAKRRSGQKGGGK